MDKESGADPAFVASQSSRQGVSTKGFNPGEGILEALARSRHDLLRVSMRPPEEIKVAPDTYDAIRARVDARALVYDAKGLPPSVFGMRIVIDPTMKPGEWEIVPPDSPMYRTR